MKKFFSIFGIFCLFLFSSCTTVDYSEAEYYSVEEIMDTWEESIYDYDLDQQMSVYWPDAYAVLHFDEEKFPPEREGRDEIHALMEEIKGDNFDLGDFEFPPYEIVPDAGNDVVSVFYHYEDMMRAESLTLTRRGELWGIEEHYFYYFEAEPVNVLSEWADENGTGLIEPWEREILSMAVHMLLSGSHSVENGLDEVFDINGNGEIDEGEVYDARTYFVRFALPRILEEHQWFGPEYFDLDRNGEALPEEIESVTEYILTWQHDSPLDRADDDPLVRYLDEDGNGRLERHEKNNLFWHVTYNLLILLRDPLHPHDVINNNGEEQTRTVIRDEERDSIRTLDSIRGKRVAVVDISSETDKINEETRKGLVFFVENSFVNTGMVKVVDRNSIDKIFEENRFQSSSLTDEETAVEIGKLVGAEIIVTGSVTAVGSNFYLHLRMIDVKTAEVVGSSLGEAKIENEFLNMSSMAVEKLF
jgi:Curli production assembly/transport component CsgG